MDAGGVPTLDGGGVTNLGWGGVPTLGGGGGTYLEWKERYLPWMGEWVPTLDEGVTTLDGRDGTYLEGGGVPTLDGVGGGTYPGQVMPWAVCLLRLPAGGLSSLRYIRNNP